MVGLQNSIYNHFIIYLLQGCPSVVRSDYGTENCNLASVQIAMRYNHDDGLAKEKSFIYAPSKHNVVSGVEVLHANAKLG